MIKRNNKGFTLLELLVSIFILTTVIFVGYRVINKSTIDIKNQSNINKGQLTVNDMNEYLTKDLEQASSIVLFVDDKKIIDTSLEENSTEEQRILLSKLSKEQLEKSLANISSTDEEFTYSYNIRFKEDEESENDTYSRIYSVEITKDDKDNYRYSVSREETDGISISFITDEILKEEELPFIIEGNSPYKVTLGYNGKNNEFEKHEFTVTYRLNDNTTIPPEQETPPPVEDIVPPSNWGDYNAIGFWTADSNKKTEDNLYTWISTEGKILGEAYADQENGKNDIFNIEGEARPGNNTETSSYIGYKNIDTDTDWAGQVKNINIGDKDISNISIYISKGTTLEDFEIKQEQGNAKIEIEEPLHEGWNHCTITKNGNSKVNFKFTGKLSIDKNKVSSGYAYVVYERVYNGTSGGNTPGTSDLDGDIVFEFIRTTEKNVNMAMEINVGNNPIKSETRETANSSHNFVALVKTDGQSRVDITGVGDLGSYDDKFKTVKGVEVKLVGNITVPKFKIDNIMTNEISLPLNYNNKFYFTQSGQYGVRFNEVRFDNLKNGETGRIIINLIY